jgi:hypothetical protein
LQRDVLFFLPHVSQQGTAPEKTYTLGRHRRQDEKKARLMWTLLSTHNNHSKAMANACSIKGNVKENISPTTGSRKELLDFQPLLAMKDAWL